MPKLVPKPKTNDDSQPSALMVHPAKAYSPNESKTCHTTCDTRQCSHNGDSIIDRELDSDIFHTLDLTRTLLLRAN